MTTTAIDKNDVENLLLIWIYKALQNNKGTQKISLASFVRLVLWNIYMIRSRQ